MPCCDVRTVIKSRSCKVSRILKCAITFEIQWKFGYRSISQIYTTQGDNCLKFMKWKIQFLTENSQCVILGSGLIIQVVSSLTHINSSLWGQLPGYVIQSIVILLLSVTFMSREHEKDQCLSMTCSVCSRSIFLLYY